jgi:hypothetical protein
MYASSGTSQAFGEKMPLLKASISAIRPCAPQAKSVPRSARAKPPLTLGRKGGTPDQGIRKWEKGTEKKKSDRERRSRDKERDQKTMKTEAKTAITERRQRSLIESQVTGSARPKIKQAKTNP